MAVAVTVGAVLLATPLPWNWISSMSNSAADPLPVNTKYTGPSPPAAVTGETPVVSQVSQPPVGVIFVVARSSPSTAPWRTSTVPPLPADE